MNCLWKKSLYFITLVDSNSFFFKIPSWDKNYLKVYKLNYQMSLFHDITTFIIRKNKLIEIDPKASLSPSTIQELPENIE